MSTENLKNITEVLVAASQKSNNFSGVKQHNARTGIQPKHKKELFHLLCLSVIKTSEQGERQSKKTQLCLYEG